MSEVTLPHESTADFRVNEIVGESKAMLTFLAGLTPFEQRRFMEFAQHFYHDGLEEGLHRMVPVDLTEEQKARVLVHQSEIYLQGAGKFAEELEGLREA